MLKTNRHTISVVVIDSSMSARELLATVLQREPGIEVVGTGADGHDAVRLVKTTHPNILLVELRMSRMDGLAATRQIMREAPLPIILISGSLMPQETDLTFKALQAGALAVLRKPGVNDAEGYANLIRTVRTMAGVPVIHHWGRLLQDEVKDARQLHGVKPSSALMKKMTHIEVIGIAASTGGPAALVAILKDLPKTFPIPILIVQHMSRGFDIGFTAWLGKKAQLETVIASQGERLRPGTIFVAPDDYHLETTRSGTLSLSKDPPYKGLRPSANSMFQSLAKAFGERSLGLVLTGMGDDGAKGIHELHKSGGFVIAQDEASCVVYGMPKEAVMRNAVDAVLNLEQIAQILEKVAADKQDSHSRG